ncbi:MAG: hypothetical protein HQM09_15090 [Candidatus Riflebacteria bacterium]|nr:hypothetical protein [Candidatus Riflebacteria bacterium]
MTVPQVVTNPNNLPALADLMQSQEFFKQVCDMMKANHMIARLGAGNVFFMTEAGQTKRGFKVKVDLDYGKHFAFPAGPDQRPMILGEGYDFINQYSNIEVIRPKTLMAQDGTEKGNPYFERDEKTGSITSMFIRGLAIGYSPTGNLVGIDKTIFVNLPTLLVQEIQAKIKRSPSLGMMGTRDQRPTEITYYKDNGKWGKNKIVDTEPTTVKAVGAWHFIGLTGDLGYWVNISHPEIQAAFESFSQKQRFLDRSASTILNRLLLAQHPAIATKTPIVTELNVTEDYGKKIQSAKAHMFVYGWTADKDPKQRREDILAMADRLARGEDAANLEIKIDRTDVVDVTTEAEIADIVHSEADPSEIQTPSDDDEWGNSDAQSQPETVTPAPIDPPKTEPEPTPLPIRFFICKSCGEIHSEREKPNGCRKCGDVELKEYPTMAAAKANARKVTPAEKAPIDPPAKETPAQSAPVQDLTKFLTDKTTDKKIAIKVRDELGLDDFTALRKAEPAKLSEFFSKYNAAMTAKG